MSMPDLYKETNVYQKNAIGGGISEAEKVANNYLSSDSTGIMVADLSDGEETPSTATGRNVRITNEATEIRNGQDVLASYGDEIVIGKEDATHSVIASGGMQVYAGDGTKQLANIGYGEGQGASGTSTAPFYTFGTRAAGSTVGNYSFAEGYGTEAAAYAAHAEGNGAAADGTYSHAEGNGTKVYSGAIASHAEGYETECKGRYSHVEGQGSVVKMAIDAAHAGGLYTIAASDAQTVIGKYNVEDHNNTYAFIIGKGTADNARSNAMSVSWDGDISAAGKLKSIDWTGSQRVPATSANTDGGRVGWMQSMASALRVSGQWGTTGDTYTTKDIAISSSDKRLKENISDCEIEALPVIEKLRMRQFNWKRTGEHQNIGIVADEVEQIDPRLVLGGGEDEYGNPHYKTIDDFYLDGYLLKGIQELAAEVKRLTAKVKDLEERLGDADGTCRD